MKVIKNLIPYLAIIALVMMIRSFIATPIIVQGDSMKPTLNGNEIMMLKKYDKNFERFDVVVVNKSVEGDNLIKRVIGMPGETIEYKNDQLYINGKVIDDPYGTGITGVIKPITMGENEYFVMGDNRTVSLDSRVLGVIAKDEIEGTVNFVIYPFKKFGKLN